MRRDRGLLEVIREREDFLEVRRDRGRFRGAKRGRNF